MTELQTSGQRLFFLRRLSGKSRAQITALYGIPEISLRRLEDDQYKLTEKTAKRCYEAYIQEGIYLTLDWLKEGVGLDPVFATQFNRTLSTLSVREERLTLDKPLDDALIQVQEAYDFQAKHDRAVVLFVTGDEMLPFYAPGDYVGGILLDVSRPEALKVCLGRDCIIELADHMHTLRRLMQVDDKPLFNLGSLNLATQSREPVMYGREVLRAAPVIWHRRPQPRIPQS